MVTSTEVDIWSENYCLVSLENALPSYPLVPFPFGSMSIKPLLFQDAMEFSCPNATSSRWVETTDPLRLIFNTQQYQSMLSICLTFARMVEWSVTLPALFEVSRTVALNSLRKKSFSALALWRMDVQGWPDCKVAWSWSQCQGGRGQRFCCCAGSSPRGNFLGGSFLTYRQHLF